MSSNDVKGTLTQISSASKSAGREIMDVATDSPWTRYVAAGSLVAGAVLVVAGRPRTALAVTAAGAATLLLERPEAAQELWQKLPGYLRSGQDFLVRAESTIERLTEQAMKIRETIGQQG
jgi:hypothetical protein